jgi:hypothetical protein
MKVCKFYDTYVTQCILLVIAALVVNIPSFLNENDQWIVVISAIVGVGLCMFIDGKETKWRLIERLKMAFFTSSGFLGFVFHLGYQNFVLPRWCRKSFPKSDIHKTWFSGYYGGGITSVLERAK